VSWSHKFREPIELPNGERLVTLRDAIAWLAKAVPASEHDLPVVQMAAHCVTDAAESNGPMVFARISMLKAINRDKPREFTPSHRPHHWGKRKLKRDE
jgi:hypothetical protein